MGSSLQNANYQLFLLITGKPLESKNQQEKFEVKFILSILDTIGCKKPFLDTYYWFLLQGGGDLQKITLGEIANNRSKPRITS
jgi:hypothetical protein